MDTVADIAADIAAAVTIRQISPMYIAYVPHVGPYETVSKAWGVLYRSLFFRMHLGGEKTQLIGVCYDDPKQTEAAKIRYEACATVSPGYRAGRGLRTRMLPGGTYAVAQHKGPYIEVGRIYDALYAQWLPHSGFALRGEPSLEFYLNDPRKVAPQDLLTDVCVPVRISHPSLLN